MNTANQPAGDDVSRRRFLQSSTAAVAAGALASLRAPHVHAAFSEKSAGVKIGLIGCGGRGTGALLNALGAAVKSIYPEEGYHTEDVAEGAIQKHDDIQVLG